MTESLSFDRLVCVWHSMWITERVCWSFILQHHLNKCTKTPQWWDYFPFHFPKQIIPDNAALRPKSEALIRVAQDRAVISTFRIFRDWPVLPCTTVLSNVHTAGCYESFRRDFTCSNIHERTLCLMNNVWNEQIIFAYIQAHAVEASSDSGGKCYAQLCSFSCTHEKLSVYVYNFGRYLFCYILNNNIFWKAK